LPPRRFRLESLEVEGFRGFTSRQTIRLEGKSAFLFGPNGFGKSSIAEAVRWCLFGGTAVENPVNDWYAGSCEVRMDLLRGSERFSIVRTQLHGTRESERPKVFGPGGSIQSLSDFAPHLKDFGDKGTRFIFAGQGPREHAEIRLDEFDRVLGAYVGFSPVGSAGTDADRFADEHNVTCSNLESRLQRLGQEATREKSGLLTQANELDAPNAPLTFDDLKSRIFEFCERVSRIVRGAPYEPSVNTLLGDTLTDAANMLTSGVATARLVQVRSELEGDINRIAEISRREADAVTTVASIVGELEQLNSEMSGQLDLGPDNLLEARARELEARIDEREAVRSVRIAAARYCAQHGYDQCPVCSSKLSEQTRTALEGESSVGAGSPDPLQDDLMRTRAALETRSRLAGQIRDKTSQRETSEREKGGAATKRAELLASLVTKYGLNEADLSNVRSRLVDRLGEVELNERAATDVVEQRQVELTQLRSFLRRFEFNEKASAVDKFIVGLEVQRASQVIIEYRRLVSSVGSIAAAIEKVRRVELSASIPAVQHEIDVIYPLLTGQRSYPQARLRFKQNQPEDQNWGLALEVGRSDRQVWFSPESRLNNQAWNALHILLFLVFGQLGLLDHELDLFIVDDPSQSFDKGHVRSLLKLVSHISETTQIILATHDEDVYRPLVNDLFDRGRIAVVSVTDFTPDQGPSLSHEG
jgi:DNA repair exonuclease SbcCD ATPase subunit